jgi:hypothetical protein
LKAKKYIKDNNIFLFSHASYLFNFATLDNYESKINSALNDLFYDSLNEIEAQSMILKQSV